MRLHGAGNGQAASKAGEGEVDPAQGDVEKVIEYGRGKIAVKMIGVGLVLGVFGVPMLYLDKQLLGMAAIALGAIILLWQIRDMTTGQPLLRISPAGVRVNVDGYVFVDIPWRAVEAIDALDTKTRTVLPNPRSYADRSPGEPTSFAIEKNYRGVIALRVSREFYEQTIQPNRLAVSNRSGGLARYLRTGMASYIGSPRDGMALGWGSIFVARGNERYVALHHAILPVRPEQLRAIVEARWRAFGDAGVAKAQG